jgi:hypothetical protein
VEAPAPVNPTPSSALAPAEPQPEASAGSPPPVPQRAAKKKQGYLRLVLRGTGKVWVDGKFKADVPPNNKLRLPEGPHTLEITNPRAQPYKANITITGGQTLDLRVTLQPAVSAIGKK